MIRIFFKKNVKIVLHIFFMRKILKIIILISFIPK